MVIYIKIVFVTKIGIRSFMLKQNIKKVQKICISTLIRTVYLDFNLVFIIAS